MKISYSAAGKTSIVVCITGIISIFLAYHISDTYQQLSYQHNSRIVKQLANLELKNLINELKSDSLDLALAIEHENNQAFSEVSVTQGNKLTRQLDNQFYQYFVTAGIIKLLKLYILNTDFTLLSVSSEGIRTDMDSELICPQLSQSALSRRGTEKLQTMAQACLYHDRPVYAVIVPFGGLNPKGYIKVITDLTFNLRKLEQALEMPVHIQSANGNTLYQSKNWPSTAGDKNFTQSRIPVTSDDNRLIMYITLNSDMTIFNKKSAEYLKFMATITLAATLLLLFLALLILKLTKSS